MCGKGIVLGLFRSSTTSGGTPDGGFPTLILWPLATPPVTLVAPVAAQTPSRRPRAGSFFPPHGSAGL